jgi:hypothetical protein
MGTECGVFIHCHDGERQRLHDMQEICVTLHPDAVSFQMETQSPRGTERQLARGMGWSSLEAAYQGKPSVQLVQDTCLVIETSNSVWYAGRVMASHVADEEYIR